MRSHGNQCLHSIGRQARLVTSPCFTSQGSHCSLCGSVLAHAWPWAGCAWLSSVLRAHMHAHALLKFIRHQVNGEKLYSNDIMAATESGGEIWMNIKDLYYVCLKTWILTIWHIRSSADSPFDLTILCLTAYGLSVRYTVRPSRLK